MTERFFADSSRSYDEIRQDIERLSYLNENGMFYVYQDGAVYGIDLSSKEYMVVADGLTEKTSAISSDRTRLAWLEGQGAYEAKAIHVFNMATGEKQEIQAPEGKRSSYARICSGRFCVWTGSSGGYLDVERPCRRSSDVCDSDRG